MENLPNKSFVFNFNAKNYNTSTRTIPKESGASMDKDMVFSGTSSSVINNISFDTDHVSVPKYGYSLFDFGTSGANPMNNTESEPAMTIVAKFKADISSESNFLCNRDNITYNYFARCGDGSINSYFLSLGTLGGTNRGPDYSSGDTVIAVWRVNTNREIDIKNLTNNTSTNIGTTTWNGGVKWFTFFMRRTGTASSNWNEPMACDFYWCYASREYLTDAEIQQVVRYNEGASIRFDVDNISLPSSGGTSGVTVTSENAWTATKPDWVSISPNTGNAGETEVSVSAGVNRGKETRSGNVVFTDGEDSANLSVTQAGYTTAILKNLYRNGSAVRMMFRNGDVIYRMIQKLVFSVDKDSITFDTSGNSTTITITANDKWIMTVPNWITASALSGTTGATITLTASATEDNREGQIVISCEGKTHTIEVEQVADYSKMYLTIEALETGSFTIRNVVGYSVNGGEWATSTAGQVLSIQSGDKVRLKHTMTAGRQLEGMVSGNTLSCKMYGNIMSLANGDNFENSLTLTYASAFSQSFYNIIGLADASNVVMPATTITNYCYRYAFADCTNLVDGPNELPAKTLANSCYRNMFQACNNLKNGPDLPAEMLVTNSYYRMFYNCSALNYVKCLATNISASNSHSDWVYGVQTTSGKFVKSPNITESTWGRSTSGIPTNWTVENAVL